MGNDKTHSQDWLDSAVADKASLLKFTPPFNESSFTINIGRFGFKNPDDLKNFLRTPAGDTIKGELSDRIAEEQAIEDQRQFELDQEAIRKSRLKALLFLWLIEKKGHAAEKLREFIEVQNEHFLKEHAKDAISSQKSSPPSASEILADVLADYDKAFKEYNKVYDTLSQNDKQLKEELSHLIHQKEIINKKHSVYDESLASFDKASQDYDSLNREELRQKISDLEKDLFTQTDQILALLDQGKEDEARTLIHQQNALNLQIASLHDIKSRHEEDQEKQTIFLDDEGKITTSHKDSSFVFPKQLAQTKQLVKEHGQYYLIDLDKKLSDLNSGEKVQAKSDFDGMSHEIMSVKKAVQHTRKLEMEFQDSRIEDTESKIGENQLQLKMIRTQMTLVQASRANAETLKLPKPTPPVTDFFKKNQDIFKTPSLSSQLLFTQIDKTQPKNAEEIKAFLKKSCTLLGLSQIPSMAPLPQTTMVSLLQHMARFGANPYKFNPSPKEIASHPLTPMENSLDCKTKRTFNPSPFSKTPFGGG